MTVSTFCFVLHTILVLSLKVKRDQFLSYPSASSLHAPAVLSLPVVCFTAVRCSFPEMKGDKKREVPDFER